MPHLLHIRAAITFSLMLVVGVGMAQEDHCKVRYTYNASGDRIQRDWYCWTPGHEEDVDPKNASTSIEEVRFSIMPNPASDQLTVSIPAEVASGTLQLLNAFGTLVDTRQVNSASTVFDVSDLASGNYFIRFTRGSEMLITPCIVQR